MWADGQGKPPCNVLSFHQKKLAALARVLSTSAPASLGLTLEFSAGLFKGKLQYHGTVH